MRRFQWILAMAIMPGSLIIAGSLTPVLEGRAGGAGKELLKEKEGDRSAAYKLLDIALEATAREHDRHEARRPTIGSPTPAILMSAMFDAWAASTPVAVGTRLGDKLAARRPNAPPPTRKRRSAYATYRACSTVYPEDAKWITGSTWAAIRTSIQGQSHFRH